LARPSLLHDKVKYLDKGAWVWIDEVQKIPALLDEVHSLIEDGYKFALSGSSARKLKRVGNNLLAGRAIPLHLDPLSFSEMKNKWSLDERVLWGNLPLVVNKAVTAKQTLRTYVNTYLKEEIQLEGHVRKLEPFIRFLEVAAVMNGQIINSSSLAREAQVSRPSIEGYFSILIDTLIGSFVPAFQPRAKVKELDHPKFYFFDSGVARATAGLLDETIDKDWLGFSFETMILHELKVRNHVSGQERKIMYYKVQSGREVDFVVEIKKGSLRSIPEVILIEVKYSKVWKIEWEKEVVDLSNSSKLKVKQAYGVYCGDEIFKKEHILILPIENFLSLLHKGKIF
jgi:predicted AAA+ superfamily ATPase